MSSMAVAVQQAQREAADKWGTDAASLQRALVVMRASGFSWVQVHEALDTPYVVLALRRDSLVAEVAFQAELRSAFTKLGVHVHDASKRLAEPPVHEAISVPVPEATTYANRLLIAAELSKWTDTNLRPKFEQQFARMAAMTLRTLEKGGVKVSDTARGQVAQRVLAEGGRRLGLVDIVGDTRTAVFRALDFGLQQGLNPRETATLFRSFVPAGRFVNAGASYRAQLISRTETLHAQRKSTLEYYKGSANVHRVIAYDGEKDNHCATRNGQEFSITDAEVEMASTHPQCVLAFGPVVS